MNSSPASARLHTALTSPGAPAAVEQVEHADRRPCGRTPKIRSNSSAAALLIASQPVLEIDDLHEGVRAFDDVGQDLALGERFGDAALERLVQLAQAPSLSRSARSASTRCVVSETAQNIPATLPLSSRTGE